MKVAKGVLSAPTVNGTTQSLDLSSVFAALEPLRAIMWIATLDTAAAVVDGDGILAIGWTTNDGGSIQQAYQTYFDDDAVGTSAGARGINTDASLRGITASAPTIDYELDITAWSSTGVTLTWIDAPASAIKVHYFALGGSDVSAARAFSFTMTATVATQNVTINTGFGQPDLIFLNTIGTSAAVSSEASHPKHTFSVAKSATERRSVQHMSANAAATMNVVNAQHDRAFMHYSTAAALQQEGDLSAKASWPTDGFQLSFSTQATGPSFYIGLALKGTFTATIGKGAAPTAAAPQTQNLSHTTGTPRGALLFGCPVVASAGVLNAAGDNGGFFIGATDGTNQGLGAVVQDHGNTTSMAGRIHSENKVIANYLATTPTAAPVRQSQASASISGSNVVLTWDDTDTVAREYSYVIFGDGPDTTSPVPTVDTVTATKISRVASKDSFDITFSSGEAFVEYKIKKVSNSADLHTQGTLIEGTTVTSRTSHTVTITDEEFVDTGLASEGTNIVKVFVKDAAGNWSI